MGELLPEAYDPDNIPEVSDLDELQTFVGAKSGCDPASFYDASGETLRRLAALKGMLTKTGNAHQEKQNLGLDSCRPFQARYPSVGCRGQKCENV